MKITMKHWDNETMKSGTSILEVIVAVAVFSLMASAMVSMVVGGFDAVVRGGQHTKATALAQEAVEAVRSIRDGAWNENTYNQSAVSISGNEWIFSGEGTTDVIGIYTRTITFDDVCRNISDEIVACPGNYTDVHSKRVTVSVEWEARAGITNTIERVLYLTNWDSNEWVEDVVVDFDDGTFNNTATSTAWGDGDGDIIIELTNNPGTYISSAFDIGSPGNFNIIEWTESKTNPGCATCVIKLQIKTTPDDGGSPGVWSATWCGPQGEDGDETDFFTIASGELIHLDHNGDQWIQYLATLEGDGIDSPVLEDIKINYK